MIRIAVDKKNEKVYYGDWQVEKCRRIIRLIKCVINYIIIQNIG